MKLIPLIYLVALTPLLGGCEVPAAIYYKTFGPPPIPARFTPSATDPLLVMVENANSPAGSVPEADELALALFHDLKEYNVAPLIDPDRVHELRQNSPGTFTKMGIAEIGRKLGAKQVVYISLKKLQFDNPPGSDSVMMTVSARVKVVDASSANTVWPTNGSEEYYDYESRYRRITPDVSANALKREILMQCGTEIGRWFHAYQPENMTEENKDVRLR